MHKQKFLKEGLKIKKKTTSVLIFYFIHFFDIAILAGSQFPDWVLNLCPCNGSTDHQGSTLKL